MSNRPHITMDPTPEARRAFLRWLSTDHNPLVIYMVVVLQGIAYGMFLGVILRPGGHWPLGLYPAVSVIAVIQSGLAFWHGFRYAERRSRRITRDCDLVIERFNDLLGDLADHDMIAPGQNATHILRSTSDAKH